MRRRALVKSLTVAAAIAAAWEAVVRSGLVSRIILAAPSDIVHAAASDGGVFLRAFATTLAEIGAAIVIAWTLGIGSLSKVAFGAFSGFFPIVLNTIDGVRAIEPRYLALARSIGATRLQTHARIVFPLALPAMVSGLRVGTGLVVIGVLVTEMLASLGGVGFLISYHRTLFDTGHVYFGMLLALLLAVAVNIGLTRLDRRIGRWQRREQAQE